MRDLARRLLVKENGNVVVVIAVAFSVLVGFTALAVDSGVLFLEYNRLARAVDAAALAGAQELPNSTKANNTAVDFAQRNEIDTATPGAFSVSFSSDNRRITVEAKKDVGLYFAKTLGFNSSTVKRRAVARISPVRNTKGLIPVGIDESLLPLTVGNQYIIKVAKPSTGWTGILAYPGQSGADDYRLSARYGYNGVVSIGEDHNKATGNVTGPTIQGLEERITASNDTWNNPLPNSPRIALVPIYRVLGPGPGDKVKIVAFVSVFLNKVTGTGNENEVHVTYINHTVSGEADDSLTNSHLNTVRLVE